MAMKKGTKNILVHCGAGVVALALTVFGISQCSGKKAARAELDSVRTEIEKAKTRANKTEEALLDARDSLSYYVYQNEDLKDQIAVRDTAIAEMAKNLEDCGKGKKRTTSTKRTPRPTTPATRPAARPATGTATTVVNVNTTPSGDATTIANTKPSEPVTIVTVTTPDDKTPINANGVTIGENAHHNNININNGTINNYYAPVDTVKKYAAASQTIVIKKRVVCVPQK